ncbi:MAG: 4-hydroxythreonine-4-phosphate dehydrogenase PdxA [Pseudomonadales bacterium]
MKNDIRLAITAGEPAGIGPDLLIKMAQRPRDSCWVAIADTGLLERSARRLGVTVEFDENFEAPSTAAGRLTVRHTALAEHENPGRLDVANVPYVLETLELATDGCLSGAFAGVVTGPVQKSVINDAGHPFSGHTEFFCDRAAVEDVVMLLVAGKLRVALATTHLPLAAVAAAITPGLLRRRIGILLAGLKSDFGLQDPEILVSGLNPHAGEGGHLGTEEVEIIGPVCEEFRLAGVRLTGPLPADTLFTPDLLGDADAVLAMYHDQGLPVLKHQGFGRAVNVTLGLPFIRTSVDHGTALDLAGSGDIDPGSFIEAVGLAEILAANR